MISCFDYRHAVYANYRHAVYANYRHAVYANYSDFKSSPFL
jgi:hypothetical protein